MFFKNINKEYQDIVFSLCSEMSNATGFDFIPMSGISCGYGLSDITMENNTKECIIGTKELYLKNISSDYLRFNLVKTIITIYHEAKHIEQFNSVKNGEAAFDITICYLSRCYNNKYYRINYDRDIMEIEAEKHGIINAHSYLLSNFGDKQILSYIKKYVKSKKTGMYDFYLENIDNAPNITSLVNMIFVPLLQSNCATRKTFNGCKGDTFVDYMDRYWYETGDNPKSDVLVSSADNINLLCDKLVASITVELHPEYEELCIKNGVQVPKFEDILLEIKGLAKEERDV